MQETQLQQKEILAEKKENVAAQNFCHKFSKLLSKTFRK